ncbi:ATP-binding protein [Candidatus Falkowbacteria bacterium]|nr:ATP-binding protein [Candidatus Falkowbacteria bacterium]
MPDKPKENKRRVPDWFRELVQKFRAGISREFVIYGDINGLTPNPDAAEETETPYLTLRQFIERFLDHRQIVVFYNIASGISFLLPEMEKEFRQTVGFSEDASAASGDAVAAARAKLQSKRSLPREPDACLELMEKLLKKQEKSAVVIQSVHFVAPAVSGGMGAALPQNERANVERLKNWARDEDIENNGNLILLVTDQLAKIHPELKDAGNSIQAICVAKPDWEERKLFLETITEGNQAYRELRERIKGLEERLQKLKPAKRQEVEEEKQEAEETLDQFTNVFPVPDSFDLGQFTVATQGLNLQQIFEVFLSCRASGQEISLQMVKTKKNEILNNEYGEVMEIVDSKLCLDDIGGMEHIKEYFNQALRNIKAGNFLFVPMGITLMGPPGTGKTAIVEALATEASYTFVRTKNIRSMWVGESEARMEKMIFGLRSLAPVVVMNDEADLSEAQRDSVKGDSGVSERLMKRWMELLSDPKIRGKILVINCTNRPDRLDAALKRSGRSDERILLPMPSEEERTAIFQVMFNRYKIPTETTDFRLYANLSAGLSGADIEKISLSAYQRANMKGKEKVGGEELREAIADFIPSASQRDIDLMTLCGTLESSSRQLLPKHLKEILVGIVERRLVPNIDELLHQLVERKIIEPSNGAVPFSPSMN